MNWDSKVMLAIITYIISVIIAVIGICQKNTSPVESASFFGLTRTGAVLVALSVIGGITGTLLVINDYRVKRTPVVVSPDKISAYIGKLETQTPFEVHNRSNEAVYTIWVKIAPETQKFQTFYLLRLIADDGRTFIPMLGGKFSDSEGLMLAAVDRNKQPVVFLVIRSLSAGENRKFSFHVQSSANVKEGQPVAFDFTVVKYGKEPYWFGVGVSEDTVAFKLDRVPEDFTINTKSFPFLMLEKRSQPNR